VDVHGGRRKEWVSAKIMFVTRGEDTKDQRSFGLQTSRECSS